jgi:tetratricopeptide (TPR) repeat protein
MNEYGLLFLIFFVVSLSLAAIFLADRRRLRLRRLIRAAFSAANSRQYQMAIGLCDEILDTLPRYAWAYTIRGACRLPIGEYDDAIRDCTLAIEIDESHAEDFLNRAYAYQATGQFDKAVADLTTALGFKADDSEVLVARAQCYQSLGDHPAAAEDFAQAVTYNSGNPAACFARGCAYAALERYHEAVEELSNVIRDYPDSIEAYDFRSHALYKDGQHKAAIADAERVLCTYPECSNAINRIAWIQATSWDAQVRNGNSALAKARRACEITEFKRWALVDSLAAAHAEVGEFEEAVRWAEKALELAPDPSRCRIEVKIPLYRQKKPWREFAITGQVVNAGAAKAVTAIAQLGVEPLQHAQAELALALDGDDAGMRQPALGV